MMMIMFNVHSLSSPSLGLGHHWFGTRRLVPITRAHHITSSDSDSDSDSETNRHERLGLNEPKTLEQLE